MQVARRSIFRDKALKHYAQGRKKDTLPSFSSIPVAIFFWGLLVSLLATGLLAAYIRVPVYLNGTGIVLDGSSQTLPGNNRAALLVFFQSGVAAGLHAGLPVTIQTNAGGPQLTSTITEVEAGAASPAATLAHYGVNAGSSVLSSKPEVSVFIGLGANFPVALYAGSTLAMQVNVGTQSLFSALTGIGNVTGE